MTRTRNFIHSKLTPELLLEISEKYKFASDILKEYRIGSSDLKRAYEHYNIPYPFAKQKGMSYKPASSKNENFFAEKTEKSFYWAGFLAADGYIREKLKQEYDKLQSLTAVAKIYGCDRAVVSKAMKTFGIPFISNRNQFNCTIA